ncbi:AAA family ATPase [Actinomadura decatromicini]|uniref:AAA family ATPase n=1 Tax=Actinomadura decatromicini TaxID=2604572 RepID=A0A5D3FVZ4_9ACTN|nr:AAA family ATPase [Actinomadura decatromicini]TYK53027.1 AAA family ATPase [Actinomadura decatromicini]
MGLTAEPDHSDSGRPDLIGRRSEIHRLRRFVDRVRHGTAGALQLTGDPGVGKTALLEYVAALATSTGITVLRATGSQFEADIPYAALHQLLHPCLDELPHLSPPLADALTVALGLRQGPPPTTLLVANAVLALLHHVAEQRPLLLLVDDLPWLDRTSALALGMAARRLDDRPVALLAACRTGEPSFFDHAHLPITPIDPLSDDAAAALLSSRYPAMTPRVRRRLLEAALGNPLALLELPVSLGELTRTGAGPLPQALPLTRRLQNVFASRLQTLPAPVHDLLLLAVLDGTGDLRLIRAIAADRAARRPGDLDGDLDGDLGGEHAADGLCLAEQTGLVRADEISERLTFRHPLIRSAIVEMSTSEQRRRAHAELADRLADQPERYAWHLAAATTGPDEKIAAVLQRVAHTNLLRGDSLGAVTQLLRAADLSPTGHGRSERLAEAAYLGSVVTGDLHEAPHLLEQAHLAHPGPGGPLPTALADAYLLLNRDGDIDSAYRLLTTAVHHLDDPRDGHHNTLWEVLYTLIMICFFSGRADLWPPVQHLVDQLRPRPPEILAILSRTFSDPARLTPGMLARAEDSVANLGHHNSPARIIRTGIAVAYLDRLSGCREPLQRAVQHGREGGAVTSAIEALFLLAQDAFHTGRWDEARDLAEEGLRLCATHGYDLLTWPGRLTMGLLAAARGDTPAATGIAQDMEAWAMPRRVGILATYAHHIRGLAALSQADYDTAFHHAAAINPPGTLAPYAPHALWVLHDLIEAATHTGRRDLAAAHIKAARDLDLGRLSPRLRLVLLAGSTLTGLDTDPTDLEAAIKEPGNDRWPFDLARIQLTYGSHLRRARNTSDARRHLTAAADTFHRLGATPWAARADHELRATGISHTTSTTGLASLTPQQLQIARLAAAGHTNKEIAARLFLSPRTVSTHLYQAFPKLGITSRAALRDALTDPPLHENPEPGDER